MIMLLNGISESGNKRTSWTIREPALSIPETGKWKYNEVRR